MRLILIALLLGFFVSCGGSPNDRDQENSPLEGTWIIEPILPVNSIGSGAFVVDEADALSTELVIESDLDATLRSVGGQIPLYIGIGADSDEVTAFQTENFLTGSFDVSLQSGSGSVIQRFENLPCQIDSSIAFDPPSDPNTSHVLINHDITCTGADVPELLVIQYEAIVRRANETILAEPAA